jgi:hypothetical protein
MSGVHKTVDPSKPPAMPAIAPRAAGATVREPKLLDRLRDALWSRHYSRHTEQTYCHWLKRFIYYGISPHLKRCRRLKGLLSQDLCRFTCWGVLPQLRGP